LVLFSYHHKNTETVAKVLAKVLDAQIKTPQQINPEDLQKYNLIGFGSGIYGEKHTRVFLILPINYHKSTIRMPSFFRPVQRHGNYPKNTLHLRNNCKLKDILSLMNLIARVLTPTVF